MTVWLLALALDLLLGEPPSRVHPVAGIGRLLDWGRRRSRASSPLGLVITGAGLLLGLLALIVVGAALAAWLAGRLGWAGLFLQALLLKPTFSVRRLARCAIGVETSLEAGRLEEARRRVGTDLVSRPTTDLSVAQVASAAVESVAENLTDSVVAPLCFYLVGGLPGAWGYRVVNTADAMWGYREGELEHLGKPAARLDDLLNWIPARLAALGIVLGALITPGWSGAAAWRQMWSGHACTRSPNAGWTMGAMAGALGVRLEKPGAYRLGVGAVPGAAQIRQAVALMLVAGGLVVALALAAAGVGR